MSFAQENGYTPSTISALMNMVRENVNTQFGTSYTEESFVGTNFYKYFYALIQKVQENEVKTSEIFSKLQTYIDQINARVSRPVTTPLGLIEKLESEGFTASIKPTLEADAGKLFVCVDLDDEAEDYEEQKLAVATILKNSVVAGIVTMGEEVETIVLTNGQSFDFKFDLPNRIVPLLRLTITVSENNQELILSPEEVKEILLANIAARYRLGKNFEPQRYFSIVDAPWAESVLLEYSLDDGANYLSTVYEAEFDDLFECLLENTELVEA